MQIPTRSRELVLARQLGRCFGCGARLAKVGGEWAHRRPRSVRDAHTMCPCNGLYLCHTDHRWAHDNPAEARAKGWIVSRYVPDPATVPVLSMDGTSLLLLDHVGSYSIIGDEGGMAWSAEPTNT